MTGTNIPSADVGPDEDIRHSPIPPLTEHCIMKRAINHWTPPKHPSYNLIDARIDSFKNWPKMTHSPESLSKAGFFFNGTYIFTNFTVYLVFKFLFHLYLNFVISGRSDEQFASIAG